MASLRSTRDGLGGEELGQPGSQVSDVWVTGSVISDSLISGANIYATTDIIGENVYGDTVVSGPTVKATTVQGTTVSGTTVMGTIVSGTTIAGVNISGTNIGGTTFSGTTAVVTNISGATFSGTGFNNAEGELQSVSVGSPNSVYGAIIQAGSGLTTAGSTIWIVYPTAYTGQPSVNVTNITTVAKTLAIGSNTIGVGSFQAESEDASEEFCWIAVGL